MSSPQTRGCSVPAQLVAGAAVVVPACRWVISRFVKRRRAASHSVARNGAERLEDIERTSLRLAHMRWFENLVARSGQDWFGLLQIDWLARLKSEHANIRTALEYSLSEEECATAGQNMAAQ